MNYTELATIAETLIADAGRAITLIQRSRTPDISAEPWLGPDPGQSNDTRVSGTGVFVEPGSEKHLGIRAVGESADRRTDMIVLVAASAQPDAVEEFDAIEDSSGVWQISWVETLQPGNVKLLYMIGVRR